MKDEIQNEDRPGVSDTSADPGNGVESDHDFDDAEVGTDSSESEKMQYEDDDDENSEDLDLKGLFEAILFISNEPLPISAFVKNFGVDHTHSKIILDSLVDEYEDRDGGVKLVEISNGYQMVTNMKYAGRIRRFIGIKRRENLSKGMLETLAIIAYKQPVVLAEIDELRGVSSRMMVSNLLKRSLVKPVGRKELPGRPLAYGTTDLFLKFFGLNKLIDLPKLSEIKELNFEEDGV